MHIKNTLKTLAPAALLLTSTLAAAHADKPTRYIALGDSYAYGFTTLAQLESDVLANGLQGLNGEPGYVKAFGSFLGLAPTNLAIPGETAVSFLNGGDPALNVEANINYNGGYTNQAAEFTNIVTNQGQGTVLTVQVGGNDVLDSLVSGSDAQAALTALKTNEYKAFNAIHAAAPKAKVYVVGYFDPFPGITDTTNPLYPYRTSFAPILKAGNQVISADAAQFGFTFVDISAPFVGHEDQYSEIQYPLDPGSSSGTPNYHPNNLGYQIIAQQLITAAPEPSSAMVFAAGVLAIGGLILRARRKLRA